MSDRRVDNCIVQRVCGVVTRGDLEVLAAALICGVITHGSALTNKYSFHDDIYELFAPGQTFVTGRWVLGVLAKAEDILLGSASLPLWNGLLCILLLGLSAVVLTRLYGLQNRTSRILAGCAAVMMPSVVSMMGFMFTAHYYALAFLLAAIGAACLCRGGSLGRILGGMACIVLALGIYQATLPFVCGIMVLYYMQSVLRGEHLGPRFWLDAIRYLLEVFASIAVYGGIAFVFMRTMSGSATTTSYAGLSEVGHTGIGTYLSRVLLAYREFLRPTADAIYNQYPAGLHWMYTVLLVALAVLVVWRAVRAASGGQIDDTIHYVLMAVLLPLCMNLMFVMTEVKWIHAITVYAEVLLFYLLAIECEALPGAQMGAADGQQAAGNNAQDGTAQGHDAAVRSAAWWARAAAGVLAAVMVIAYARYGNLCTLKAEFLQAQATSYFNQLIVRIQSAEGYDPEMPIVYLNEQDKQADTLCDMSGFSDVVTSPYNYDTLINDYAWQTYMRYWNNFEPIVYPAGEESTWSQEIQDMPRYPAEGSIQVFEPGYIVVKF